MSKNHSMKVWIPIAALFLCGVVVVLERYGVTYEYTGEQAGKNELEFSKAIETETTCAVLATEEDVSVLYGDMMSVVLEEMKVGYDILPVEEGFDADVLEAYDTVVITFQDWSVLGDSLPEIFSWIKAGGNLMTTVAPAADGSFGTVASRLGIVSIGEAYAGIYGFRLAGGCMIGAAEDEVFWYDASGEEALYTSLQVELDEKCSIWMESEDGEVPLIWTRNYGEGTVAVVNEAIGEKYQRGFLCMTYSLLGDAVIYPVINASAFYLDDFPSPVPEGNGEYIQRDYGVDTATFYSSIWWPKVLEWEDTYGIVHTGLVIELYSDEVEAPFERNAATSQFLTFGNMLLNRGGELGFHGYNHMPLCLKGTDDALQFGEYELWSSEADMKASLEELQAFCEELFPENQFRVYVPPSNILSESGKKALAEACPGIRVIASTYLTDRDGIVYEQEFCVDEEGIIHTPRITSGCMIEEYQRICALSELNFHYVQSHFMHPDDVLDEDRGASEGWEALSREFESYLDWIYTSAPNIRNVTGSEMATAVQQYDSLTMQRRLQDGVLSVELGGFSGEASFLLRVNEGSVTGAEGCEYEKITGNLYVVQAKTDRMKLYLGE